MSPGKASFTAAARAACWVGSPPVPAGPVVERSSLRTAIAIRSVGVSFLLARYERPPGLGVTRRCPWGWNLPARVPGTQCRPGRYAPAAMQCRAVGRLAAGVMAAAAVRAPGAAGDARAVAAHLGGLRLAWLGVAVAAQGMALAGGAAAQRQLLAAGGARLRWRTVFGLVLASTGLARMMPAGPVTGGAWQVREYHRRGAGTGPGVWAVLAGGVTSTVVIVALLLAGAAAAGLGPIPLLACAAGLLAAGAAGLFAAARRARALGRWLGRRRRRSRTIAGLAAAAAGLSAGTPGPAGPPGCWRAPPRACSPTRECWPPVSGWPGSRSPGRACCSPTPPGSWPGGSSRCPADRRRGRRHARRAHPHRHPARRGGRRGHHLPGGRVLGRRRRRDRGGSRRRPPLPGASRGRDASRQPAGGPPP